MPKQVSDRMSTPAERSGYPVDLGTQWIFRHPVDFRSKIEILATVALCHHANWREFSSSRGFKSTLMCVPKFCDRNCNRNCATDALKTLKVSLLPTFEKIASFTRFWWKNLVAFDRFQKELHKRNEIRQCVNLKKWQKLFVEHFYLSSSASSRGIGKKPGRCLGSSLNLIKWIIQASFLVLLLVVHALVFTCWSTMANSF